MIWKLALALLLSYLALVALAWVFQERLVYFPQIGREIAATPAAHGVPYDEVAIRTDDGERLAAWWVPAERAQHGAVLLFHGNAGNISHRLEYAFMFRRLGYATLLVDYRGFGASSGVPSEAGTYRDAAASWRWLTHERGLRAGEIVLFGESLGGAVACWLARHETPGALVLASTFTSVPDLGAQVYPFLPVRWISRLRYGTRACLPHVRAPVLIMHSPADEVVPFSHAKALYAAANAPRRFVELAGGHNDGLVFTRPEWVDALAAFLAEARAADDAARGARENR